MEKQAVKMPILQPIPIKTKDTIWPIAIWRWLTTIRKWRLVEDYFYTLKSSDGKPFLIRIPQGFEFDGASIPRIFWMILSPTGLLLIPGLLHDYAYRFNRLWFLVYNSKENGQVFIRIKKEGVEEKGKLELWEYCPSVGRKYWDRVFREEAIRINGFVIINYVAWIVLRLCGWVVWCKHRKRETSNLIDVPLEYRD